MAMQKNDAGKNMLARGISTRSFGSVNGMSFLMSARRRLTALNMAEMDKHNLEWREKYFSRWVIFVSKRLY